MAGLAHPTLAQARLMMARAHGWKPTRMGKDMPSMAVAKEFVRKKKGTALLSRAMRSMYRAAARRKRGR